MQYVVELRCVVKKIVTCEGCTEEEAHNDPFNHAIDEMETDQLDWEVLHVEAVK